jgi:hypothetical protein
MTKKQKTVTILWGLPGSGKTHYCNAIIGEDHTSKNSIDRLDVDLIGKYHQGDELLRHVGIDTVMKLNYRPHVIIDGLVTTNEFCKKIIESIQKFNKGECKFAITFQIVWWGESRPVCIWNDKGRREQDSVTTINNMKFEEPDSKFLGVNDIQRMIVVPKPAHKVWAIRNNLGDNDVFESSSWSLGGTWCGYDGARGTVSPETPPTSFVEFDNLLENICPQITFIQYKKVYAQCVKVEEYSNHDYYGGTTHYAKFVCDLKELYKGLKSLGIELGVES